MALTGEQAKRKLHRQGSSLKNFAEIHNYSYATVSAVVRGATKCTYGKSHEIAVKLGMVAADPQTAQVPA
jgi:gp16 family phage-associated protein